MFAFPRNRIVFKALGAMKEQGSAPDISTLSHYLQSIGKLDEAGGPAYAAALINDVFPGQIQYFTEILSNGAGTGNMRPR
jgi:replicative DNA helicase